LRRDSTWNLKGYQVVIVHFSTQRSYLDTMGTVIKEYACISSVYRDLESYGGNDAYFMFVIDGELSL